MEGKQNHTLARLVPLALYLSGGAVLGQVLASGAPETTADELRRYLSAWYYADGGAAVTAADVLRILIAYLRCPLLTLALGWIGAGVTALCALAAVFGFALSFSIGCFGAAFGSAGIVLAAAALGLRCLITLPCFFLLALPFMEKRSGEWQFGDLARRLEKCGAILAAGVCVEALITPRLIRLALAWIFS